VLTVATVVLAVVLSKEFDLGRGMGGLWIASLATSLAEYFITALRAMGRYGVQAVIVISGNTVQFALTVTIVLLGVHRSRSPPQWQHRGRFMCMGHHAGPITRYRQARRPRITLHPLGAFQTRGLEPSQVKVFLARQALPCIYTAKA
jgi:hypothetical protein